jgi:hypothetical protein
MLEIKHYECQEIQEEIFEEFSDPDSIIRLSKENIEQFLSLYSKGNSIVRIISAGDDAHETIKEGLKTVDIQNAKAVLLNIITSKSKALEATNELSDQYCFSEDLPFYWALTLQENKNITLKAFIIR